MSTHIPGFQPFSGILHHFVLDKSLMMFYGHRNLLCWGIIPVKHLTHSYLKHSKLLHHFGEFSLTIENFLKYFNPSNAEATFVHITRTQRFVKTIQILSCWYSLWIALTEYSQMSIYVPGFRPFSRFFASFCIGQISSHQQHLRVKEKYLSITDNYLS